MSLCEDIEFAFKVNKRYALDADHGRIETRHCSILPAKEFLLEENILSWKGLQTIIKIHSKREIMGKVTEETLYYISDEKDLKVAYFNALARGRWGIENQLHWHLDVIFKEDQCRARNGYSSENLSVLRKLALQLIRSQDDKLSVNKRLYKAVLDVNYLKKNIAYLMLLP